jgi:hypothetical protein
MFMKKILPSLALLASFVLLNQPAASAQDIVSTSTDEVQDITKELLAGPGSVNIGGIKDIHMSFGGQMRMIPTFENNYDFGMSKNALGFIKTPNATGGMTYGLSKDFLKNHANEAGGVNGTYIRSEDRLYFNAMPKDRAWSFYAALEFDRALDTVIVDERGGRTGGSNFGLERLHGTMALPFLPFNSRLHAGWDVWGLDFGEGASMVYGDDNPGFWLTGDQGPISYNIAYLKLGENNFQNTFGDMTKAYVSNNRDRDLYAGYLDYKIDASNKVKLFYAYDQIRNIATKDLLGYFTANQTTGAPSGLGINKFDISASPNTDSHHIGGYYIGNFGPVEIFGEAVYQFGTSKYTGMGISATGVDRSTMDISAYALSADISLDLKDQVGFSVKPHIGFMYTSGDKDPNDKKLGGYQGVENAQRFSSRWGGENTIIGDTNLVLGTMLYGYLPELYGNGTPVFTGGLQNTSGYGSGRGDNPGLTMLSYGFTATPKKFIIFKTNANSFWWNEDINVNNIATPFSSSGLTTTKVKSGYVGTEWDNELTVALSKHTYIKGHVSYFFPGDVIGNVTTALGATGDSIASRYAMELIWNF